MSEELRPEFGGQLENKEVSIHSRPLIYNELADLYPLWRDALLRGDKLAQEKQVRFLQGVLAEAGVHSLIDLGGGVGTHSVPLARNGYEVTVFDGSNEALGLVKQKEKSIVTLHGRFETIDLPEKYDASICMWSTINYLLKAEDRQRFADWITSHTNRLIVVDQPNLLAYPKDFDATYEAADGHKKLKIIRDWHIEGQVRKTNFTYEVTDNAGKTEITKDGEIQYFMTLDETNNLFGQGWSAKHVLGDYDTNEPFDPATSLRLVTIFERV